MTQDRWRELKESLKTKFTFTAEGQENLSEGPGHVEFLECTTPMGEIRLELTVRPKILDKKTFYSKRAGAGTTVEYKYDEHENTLTLKAYRLGKGGEWEEIKAESFLA